MSKQANMKLIGVFVVGAIILLTAAIVIFASGQFFKEHKYCALYFQESIRGLNTGAPVYFKGVKVGTVSDIRLFYHPEEELLLSAVIVELDQDRVVNLRTGETVETEAGAITYLAKEKGLRAQLDLQSLVTGMLIITLDFYPDKPATLYNYLKEYEEIPTIPTQYEELTRALRELPLKEMAKKLDKIIAGIEGIVNSQETREGIKSLAQAGKEARQMIGKMNEQLGPVLAELKTTSAAARGAFQQAEKTLAMSEGVPGQLAAQAGDTLIQTRATLKKVDENLAALKKFTQGNTAVAYQLEDTLREFSAIARSLRTLTDYLEMHPEAIMTGKKKREGEKR
ncbi:MAG TPA: MlaD family protein [Syntrophales bacterium]|mgnify:FL=1|nr:MlaD family protein [Syntrophales bacterium]HPC32675.1 MlaD family protein [Syntrophales bacterium]HRR47086.1 MlaD family protein [Syntrophales bacterium]HRU88544.1 MlaD family protein [Syntrophales bacterium]